VVAIERGKKSKVGELYNESPGRDANSMFLVALGYEIDAAGRLAGRARSPPPIPACSATFGVAQDFGGPLAKQHRPFVMTMGCLLGVVEYCWNGGECSVHAAA